jgi:cytochrome c-type biogenesis protein
MEIQVWASQLLSQLAGSLNVGYAFGAGMVSAVNPCGFAMLPAYLSLYLGAGDEQFKEKSWFYRLSKAVGITCIVTAGFGFLFGTIGIVVSAGGAALFAIMPWISVLVGGGLILVGIWMLLGKHFSFDILMKLGNRIGDPRTISIRGFFLFGLAFGATSMGCTLPIFLVVVGGSLTSGDFTAGLVQFIWYILGTGTVFLVLTIAMAFIKGSVVVGFLRRIVPHVHFISALILILAGGYICYYWLKSGLLLQ